MHNLTLNLVTAMVGFSDAKHMRRQFQAPWILTHKNGHFIVATNGHTIAAVKLKGDDISLTPGSAIQLPAGKLTGAKYGRIEVRQSDNVVEFSGQYEHKAVALPACESEFIFSCLKIFSHTSTNDSVQTANDAVIDICPKYTLAREKLLNTLHTDNGAVQRTPASVFNCYKNTKIKDHHITRLHAQHTAVDGAHIIIMALDYGHKVVTAAPTSMFA